MRYDGIYRADVEDTADPEQRLRVKVRVRGIHAPSLSVDDLPFAEVSSSARRGMRGLFIPFNKGDTVFVQFEGGDETYPVITGAPVSSGSGVNDTPFDMQEDLEGGKRIMLVDDLGNTLEFAYDARKQFVRIKSGSAEVRVSGKDDGVVIDAVGKVLVKGKTVSVSSNIAEISASTVTIDARTGSTESGVATVDSDNRTDILSTGEVNIGGRVENVVGIPVVPNPVKPGSGQAAKTNLRAKDVNVGVGGLATDAVVSALGGSPVVETDSMPGPLPNIPTPPAPLLPTLNVKIRAQAKIDIESAGEVAVKATTASVKTVGAVNIESTSQVSVQAPSVSISSASITMGL